MKKAFILFVAAIMCITANEASAKKWRVNNTGIPADFTTASSLSSSPLVANGDTAYFESSIHSYGNVTFTKKLIIIGPGYFLGENDSTQADLKPASLNELVFEVGSDGSIIKGMTVTSWTTIGGGYSYVANITIEKCNLGSLAIYNGVGHVIIRNYIESVNIQGAGNVLFANNYVNRAGSSPGFSMYQNASATIMNNVFLGKIGICNAIFRNNINLLNTNYPGDFTNYNSKVENNIGASTQFGDLNGNQQNVDMSTVFLLTGSRDGMYRLKPGSPAIGAGVGGTDCGMFGGNYPYVLSGMVAGPSVWYMNLNGPEVTVKAKSH